MGAVRNSNTRASHASVEMAAGDSKVHSGGASGASVIDSPHLATDGPDRRPSFSYLRRASERRRRLRMKDRQEEDTGANARQDYGDPMRHHGSESGLESDALRKDSGSTDYHHDQHRLKRSKQIYDEEGEHELDEDGPMTEQQEEEYARTGQYPMKSTHYHHQQQQLPSEEVRRQSINDRLTDAVTDVIEFVREESFKRKRYSMHRRRQAATSSGYSAASAHSGTGSVVGVGTEPEMDSEGIGGDRSSQNYRRRRIMRRSPRRSAQPRVYNDSDTGSVASMVHDQAGNGMILDQQQHHQHYPMGQQRYGLQQHGGSIQDSRIFYGATHGRAGLIELHRRHQSADSCPPGPHDTMYCGGHQQHVDYEVDARRDDKEAPMIRPIQVGASPPPLVDSSGADLVAARRKRDEDLGALGHDDEETAIHVSSGPETGDKNKSQSPVHFIAPKVAPLNSPSAMLMPDEEIVPPDVPYRGRRLPQIPGSGIIKSAADFLHSSIYGRPDRGGAGPVAAAAAASTVAATPLVVASSRYGCPYVAPGEPSQVGESIFPSVSESPTIKIGAPIPPQPGVVKKQPLEPGSSLDGSGSINFPRVSFSPTHAAASTHTTAPPQAKRGSLAWARGRGSKKEDEEWF